MPLLEVIGEIVGLVIFILVLKRIIVGVSNKFRKYPRAEVVIKNYNDFDTNHVTLTSQHSHDAMTYAVADFIRKTSSYNMYEEGLGGMNPSTGSFMIGCGFDASGHILGD